MAVPAVNVQAIVAALRPLQARYRTLAARIAGLESISQGSVMPQPPRAWRWTRKVSGKTVSLGLAPEKAEKMKRAIANQRALDQIIDEMREITQKLILQSPELASIPTRTTPLKSRLS